MCTCLDMYRVEKLNKVALLKTKVCYFQGWKQQLFNSAWFSGETASNF